MNGKDEDIETLMAQLEIENDQLGGRMKVKELQVANIDDEVEQQPLRENELFGITQKT
jgi:hypothetical protein